MKLPEWIAFALGVIFASALGLTGVVSWYENELKAFKRAVFFAVLCALPFFLISFFEFPYKDIIVYALAGLIMLILALLLFPVDIFMAGMETVSPKPGIDERDIMFSRRLMKPGTAIFKAYYDRHPQHKGKDDLFRAEPGLLDSRSALYEPMTFAAADANFTAVAAFHPLLDKPECEDRIPVDDPAKTTSFIKNWAKRTGAISVGITELKDYHKYSYIGRGEKYGEKVEINHKFAIALTVEMDKSMMDYAPFGPVVMESSQQYLISGMIAVQTAQWIKNLGYPARAHIDGNYRVICPLVAKDAGLGEIGRMGLLMTPELGPRVRIAVVSTDMPLLLDDPLHDDSVIDFCTICKKCADVCPAKAISFDKRDKIDGVSRWQIDQEACYTFWCKSGTDCGKCMRACPYSHPKNLLHQVIRKGVSNSWLFRRLALKMDDLFYGRKPQVMHGVEWLDIKGKDDNGIRKDRI